MSLTQSIIVYYILTFVSLALYTTGEISKSIFFIFIGMTNALFFFDSYILFPKSKPESKLSGKDLSNQIGLDLGLTDKVPNDRIDKLDGLISLLESSPKPIRWVVGLVLAVCLFLLFFLLWPLRGQIQRGKIFSFLARDYQLMFPVKDVRQPIFRGKFGSLKVGKTYEFQFVNEFTDLCWLRFQIGESCLNPKPNYRNFTVKLCFVFSLNDEVIYRRSIWLRFATVGNSQKLLFKCRIPGHLPLHLPINLSVTTIESYPQDYLIQEQKNRPFYLVIFNNIGKDLPYFDYFDLEGDPID